MTSATGKPTLETVAAAVGVSRATISNAFNRPEKLSATLRATILETAERLGYGGPDPTAAGLRRGRVGVVGAIVPDSLSYAFSDPAVVVMLDGLADALDEAGAAILLISAGTGRRGPRAASVQSAVVDGFVLYGGIEDGELTAALARRGLPVVALGGGTGRKRIHVDIDEEGGSSAVAAHLYDLGHRRFGIVTLRSRNDGESGPLSDERRGSIQHATTRRRLQAALGTLAERGVDPDTVAVYEVDHNHPAEGALGAAWLLDRRRPPTAIICQSDQIALGVLTEAARRGRRVPDDLSVVGFDDIEVARLTVPALTTVRQPLRERGRTAGRLLLRTLDGQPARSTTLPTELVIRSSTGRPPRPA